MINYTCNTIIFVASFLATAVPKTHKVIDNLGMVFLHDDDIPVFSQIQTFEGLYELERPSLAIPDVLVMRLELSQGFGKSPYIRCLKRIPEFLQEQGEYMRQVENDLVSSYAGTETRVYDYLEADKYKGKIEGANTKRSIDLDGDGASESDQIGQLHSMRADEHILRVIHRTSGEIRIIEQLEDCLTEYLLYFESVKKLEVWRYIRKLDALRYNEKAIVIDEFRKEMIEQSLMSHQAAKYITLETQSVSLTNESVILNFTLSVPRSDRSISLYKVVQTGFHLPGMLDCAVLSDMPDRVTIVNGTVYHDTGCRTGLCDMISSPACFNGSVSNCAVSNVRCSPARVFSDTVGILITTSRNISKTMISGHTIELQSQPSYYIAWEGVSHITLEGVHYPDTGVYFNPRENSTVSHHVVVNTSATFTELDNFTLFHESMRSVFNTSKEETYIQFHISKERAAVENLLSSQGISISLKWVVGLIIGVLLVIILSIIGFCCCKQTCCHMKRCFTTGSKPPNNSIKQCIDQSKPFNTLHFTEAVNEKCNLYPNLH